jgi:hypothetical protein
VEGAHPGRRVLVSYVVVLTSHVPHHASACWVFDDEPTAKRFAAFVTAEIDPAVVLHALNPVKELLGWRDDQTRNRKDPAS